MAKDYAAIYAAGNDSNALEQRIYIKEEATRGTFETPTDTDLMFHTSASVAFNQPFEASPTKTGRHNNNTIKQKKEMSWSLNSLVMVDTAAAIGVAEVDQAVRTLWESTLGRETIPSGVLFDANTAPAITFSLFEVGDMWSRQARACFVNSATIEAPGDGQASFSWEGNGKDALLVGIGSIPADHASTDNVTVAAGEGKRFRVGGLTMLVAADGTTRHASTPNGTPAIVTDITGDVVTFNITLDATDTTGFYLVYYEPESPAGIDDPQTGLVGSTSIAGLSAQCIRNATINIANGHELVNYCFGEDALAAPFFIPASRLSVTASVTMNLNEDVLVFLNDVESFVSQDIDLIIGDSAGRHFKVDLPKVQFPVPAFEVPDAGSVPIDFSDGLALQTVLDAADEITVSYL